MPDNTKDSHRKARANSELADAPVIKQSWYAKYEVPRKVLHSSIGVASLVFYRYGATGSQLIRYIIPSLAIIVSADLLRFNSPGFARTYESLLGPLMRTNERTSWNGVIFYMLGTVSVLYLLPEDIATLSVVLLSWCDTAASTIGRAYGSYGPNLRKGKSVIGSLAAVATGAFATWLFYDQFAYLRPENLSWDRTNGISLGWLSLLGGIIASFSEFVDIWGIDDNLIIPILSGGLLFAGLRVLGLGG
ncbi:protein of unknown function [Taphrina deformans PYCC 5710]|uniref:Phosphatidate cytidylyltransferase n=1 Tax=Taphrina deformans (strain PYCC 5710 / ATCC 11124 / CBS 356.35 / IMI 108563 / JCM 9778 / NBRC 8474) TaxID=1097556 RepID=R4XG43_TAPDE|nr:protein of unknown function [Taphrina deformans PYCC 5710]|eukprot:CCG84853.1 protein of unknown function [Taphrina deformans PYCC 5710]